MARVTITTEVPEDLVDSKDRTGLTEQGYEEVSMALIEIGCTDIEVRKA